MFQTFIFSCSSSSTVLVVVVVVVVVVVLAINVCSIYIRLVTI